MDNVYFLGNIEYNTLTKKAVDKASRNLESALKTAIQNSYVETTASTGEMLKLTSVDYEVDNETNTIEKLLIYGPRHAFILHYGVETIAKSRTNRRRNYRLDVEETNHIAIAMEQSNVITKLANDLAEIRANQVANAFKYLSDE